MNDEEKSTTGAGPPSPALTLDQKIAAATGADIESIESEIAAIKNNAIRAIHIKALASSLKIPAKTVEADVNALLEESTDNSSGPKTVPSAHFDGLVDLALNKGQVVFLVKEPHLLVEGEYSLVMKESHQDGHLVLIPPPKKSLPFLLVQAEDVISLYNDGPDTTLFRDIYQYFTRFSFLTPGQNLIITLYVLATYAQDHPQLHYLGVIFFYGESEHGKSRTGKAATYICYRGIHIITMREPNIFRFSQDLQATIFFDMKDLWQQARKNGCEDVLLGRYEKGASVARVLFPEKGAFDDTRYFNIFGPTIAASNEAVHKILNTRTIPVTMLNKPNGYEQPTPRLGLPLKTRLTAWRGHMMGTELPTVQQIPGVSGRLWDISKPLLQLCHLLCPEAAIPAFHAYIQEIAAERAQDNSSSYEAEIVRVIRDLSPTGMNEWKLLTVAVVNNLNQDRTPEFYSHVGPTGKKIRGMGFSVKTINGKSVIFLNRQDFDLALKQYGLDLMPERKAGTAGIEDADSIVDEILNSINS